MEQMRRKDEFVLPCVDPKKVEELALLDTPPEAAFDHFTEFVCRSLGVTISTVSLIHHNRQFFKSAQGLPDGVTEIPRKFAVCDVVARSNSLVEISDASLDPDFRDHPGVLEYSVVAYIGVPIHAPDGTPVGALCAMVNKPRIWSVDDRETLKFLGEQVDTKIRLRAEAREALRLAEERLLMAREFHHRIRNAFSVASALIVISGINAESKERLIEDASVQLAALADVHGAMGFDEGSLEIADLVDRLLRPYNFSSATKTVSGPAVAISEKQLVPLSLILNELATNATKYGAYRFGGSVDLLWDVAEEILTISWTERSDGPIPQGNGDRVSFGGTMIDLSVSQLKADLSRAWDENGLSVSLSFPLV